MSEKLVTWTSFCLFLAALCASSTSTTTNKVAYSYIGGKSKDQQVPFVSSPSVGTGSSSSPSIAGAAAASAPSLAATSYYEPRGDYGGGGGGGGGYGGGGWNGGGHSVYSYHQPQPYYHPAPVYYEDGGFEGMEKGLLGLLGLSGLTGLKGLLGLLGLLKLLLPLLGLLLPLLLPLLLLKAAALLALLLLIPVPVITTGTAGRKIPTSIEEGKAFIKEGMTELLSKIPTDINQIISKIKDSSYSFTSGRAKSKKEVKLLKQIASTKSKEENKVDENTTR